MDINIFYSVVFIVIFITFYIILRITNKKINDRCGLLETQIESYEFIINELKLSVQHQQENISDKEKELSKWQLEHQQISQQLEHRIKVLQEKLAATNELVSQMQQQQPEDKLYSRAQKMVKLGADVEELVRECDLPYAEAEILIAMHHKKRQ
ncbi:DUF2802 domain-containing protein [Colwelliaceae bacterium 6441]